MAKLSATGGAATVGNFDGVHRGHAALIAVLRKWAGKVGGPAIAVTFDPHPIALLAPERLQPLLTTPADRAELLKAAGADDVVILPTTRELLALEPRVFLDYLFRDRLRVYAIVEGFNFRFGRGRDGSNETIEDWCRRSNAYFDVVPPFQLDGQVVSSSRVRDALLAGDVSAATHLLGRPYRLRGTVVVGQKRGRTLEFPTANLDRPLTLVPGDGVYAVRARLADGSEWSAAANVGPNPTFGEQARKVEAHLIGFAGELYGQEVALEFVARLRDTRRFASADELKAQLEIDRVQAMSIAARVASDAAK